MKSVAKNPRGYAFSAFRRSYRRHCSYAWFAIMRSSDLTPRIDDWIDDGLRMYDRMVFDFDVSDDDQLWELVGTIEKALSRSVAEAGKGRIRNANSVTGRLGFDRLTYSLDATPRGIDEGSQTLAQLIPEPSDPYSEVDRWEELGFRLRRLWPELTPLERRYVAALVDDPEASYKELGERFGVVRQMPAITLKSVRRKAQRLEAKHDLVV